MVLILIPYHAGNLVNELSGIYHVPGVLGLISNMLNIVNAFSVNYHSLGVLRLALELSVVCYS